MNAEKRMLSLYLRNLFFTLLQPGVVAGLIPYMILSEKIHAVMGRSWQLPQYAGMAILCLGLILLLSCILRFAQEGGGTLSPADPTKKLVIGGPYGYSRNPMYLGVLLILAGEAIFFQSVLLWIYTLFVWLVFYVFVVFREEPRLKRDFGENYHRYIRHVRRWI